MNEQKVGHVYYIPTLTVDVLPEPNLPNRIQREAIHQLIHIHLSPRPQLPNHLLAVPFHHIEHEFPEAGLGERVGRDLALRVPDLVVGVENTVSQ